MKKHDREITINVVPPPLSPEELRAIVVPELEQALKETRKKPRVTLVTREGGVTVIGAASPTPAPTSAPAADTTDQET